MKAFQSVHAADSKYHSDLYRYRSKLYRPKARAAILRRGKQVARDLFLGQQAVLEVVEDLVREAPGGRQPLELAERPPANAPFRGFAGAPSGIC